MKRLRVTYRPEAIEDLGWIYDYVARRSESRVVAQRFVTRIRARCRKIGNVPNGGRPRSDLLPGLRTVPFERSAVIAYLVSDSVEILNVFYGGKDYEALYQGRADEGDDIE